MNTFSKVSGLVLVAVLVVACGGAGEPSPSDMKTNNDTGVSRDDGRLMKDGKPVLEYPEVDAALCTAKDQALIKGSEAGTYTMMWCQVELDTKGAEVVVGGKVSYFSTGWGYGICRPGATHAPGYPDLNGCKDVAPTPAK
ncbi:MAG: hypothetical protein RLZZ324_766 [Candidatus Parcubacteria bacterium]|jgi:hypothetical protein